MAMRVVTLDRLNEFISDKTGVQHNVVKGVSHVHFVNSLSGLCSFSVSNIQVNNINDEQPFLKFRDQVSGVLVINNEVIKDNDIKPYSYLIEM